MRWFTPWVVGILLLLLPGYALADENSEEEIQEQTQANTYDEAIIRFNTNIKSFASWDEFKTEVLSKASTGTCYALTRDSANPVETSTVEMQLSSSSGWKKTSGNGWRLYKKDRTFTEYRLNTKSGMLMRVEGVKPRFFFAYNRRICEFPM